MGVPLISLEIRVIPIRVPLKEVSGVGVPIVEVS
jgi:hypothetical protein